MKYPLVITVACEKGGVGKTTIATNLAVYIKAIRENMTVTMFSFDNHFTTDKMFLLNKGRTEGNVRDLLYGQTLQELAQLGEYGVNFVPSSRNLSSIGNRYDILSKKLAMSNMDGVVIIDTGPTMDFFTKSALMASDVVLIPIKDIPSLDNIKSITDFLKESKRDTQIVKLIPSIIDGRVKFKDNNASMDGFLRSVAHERGYKLFKTSIPKSPKVEALTTSSSFKVYSILTHARGTLAHKRFVSLVKEVLSVLDEIKEPMSLALLKTPQTAGRQQSVKKKTEFKKNLPHNESFSYLKGDTDNSNFIKKKDHPKKTPSSIANNRRKKPNPLPDQKKPPIKNNDTEPTNYLWKLSRNLKQIFRMS